MRELLRRHLASRLLAPFPYRIFASPLLFLLVSASVFICAHLWLNFSVSFRSDRRKLSTEHQLKMSAQRALMRRAHSIHEMKQYLERRAEHKDLVPPVIARLRELNYLDDARYALEFARHHARLRRQGRYRIARDLRGRGVPDRHIEAALDAVFAETDEASLVRARLNRLLSHLRGQLDQRKLASLYRSLLAAGFSSEIIRAELKGVTRGDLPDFPDTPPDGP
jgi:regulatory protein